MINFVISTFVKEFYIHFNDSEILKVTGNCTYV